MPTIRIDQEVWESLQQQAKAFTDTPNRVLRRVLNLPEAEEPAPATKRNEQTFEAKSKRRESQLRKGK